MRSIITLLTDFGGRDHYVAAVKGIILSINPDANLVDISHEVIPRSIRQAGFLLASAFRYFPEGTVHLAVVDPGVGGSRQGLAAATRSYFFVGPDNGLFDQAFELEPPSLVVSLDNPRYHQPQVSATFHARDIFAPVAAHLSCGLALDNLGSAVSYRPRLPGRLSLRGQEQLRGEIIHVDRFGNLISNIEIPETAARDDFLSLEVFLGGRPLLVGPETYEQAPDAQPFALRGSSGLLEVAVRNGSAEALTGQGLGASVLVRRRR